MAKAPDDMAAVRQEIGRAFTFVHAWYFPPGRENNLRIGHAGHLALMAIFRHLEPRYLAAKDALPKT